jgi:osmotically-inducible protein OsmY
MRDETQAIVEAVRAAFREEPRLGAAFKLDRIAVEPDGALALEGDAPSLRQRKLAVTCAARVPGVAVIVDRLRLAPAVPTSDREILARLREMFAQDRDFSDLDLRQDAAPGLLEMRFDAVAGAGGEARGRIDLEAEDGAVMLNGYVPTLVRKRLAGAMAWRIPGVRDVINGLVVRPAEEDGPDEIEEAVRVVLDRNPLFDAAQIKVGVRNATVRLTGLVHSEEAKEAAELDAWAVFGVDDVVNEIGVRP